MREDFLPLAKPSITDAELTSVSEVLKSGYLTTGPKVAEFEKAISSYLGGNVTSVALNSCTAGLHLAIESMGIGKGDEVIVPTWTFAACPHAVLWTGAKPVLCDITEGTLNIDPEQIERLITPKTKAIMPVHFAGYPCDMNTILNLASLKGLKVIEDAAHAIGSAYRGKKIGSFGDITIFSFYATKNLSCGEGGMAVSKDRGLIEKIRKMSYFGINKSAFNRYTEKGSWYYEIDDLGYKYNMDSIHAALGLIQLKRLDQMNKRRREIAKMYRENLHESIKFTEDNSANHHTYHLFPIRINTDIIMRDELMNKLRTKKIGTSLHFIPLHKHPYYRKTFNNADFPIANKIYTDILSIPLFPDMTDSDVQYVIENINEILKKRG